MGSIASLRAVVTGAASGLGRAFVQELVRGGHRVIAGDIDEVGLAALTEQLGANAGSPARVFAQRCDVSRCEDVEALALRGERELGGVDLVINNAGVAVGGKVGDVSLDDWRWMMDVNLWGVVHGCHVFAPRLRAQRRGYILNIASAAGLFSPPRMAPYNVSKAGVIALSESLRAELAGDGVGVSVLCPSFFPTRIGENARLHDPKLRDAVDRQMAKSKVDANDVARYALAATLRGELYVLPTRDVRWLWRLKRSMPERFISILIHQFRKRAHVD